MKMRGKRKSSLHWPSQGGTRACKCDDCKDIITVDRAQEKREAQKEIQESLLYTEEEVSGETNPYWKSVVVEADYDELTLGEAFVSVVKQLGITYEEEEEQHDCWERGCFEPGGTFYEPPNRKARKKLTKEKTNDTK